MSAEKIFYFSDGTNQLGPLTIDDVWNLIYKNRVCLVDLIFDQRSKKWVRIVDHPDFTNSEEAGTESITVSVPTRSSDSQLIGLLPDSNVAMDLDLTAGGTPEPKQKSRPLKDKKSLSVSAVTSESWHMKEGPFTLGPYGFLQIISMIQDGTLRLFDQIRVQGGEWKKVQDVFSADEIGAFNLKVIRKKAPVKSRSEATRRKDLRKDIDSIVFISDNRLQYIVQGVDVSSGGISFLSIAPHFVIKQVLSCSFSNVTKEMRTLTGSILRHETVQGEMQTELHKYVLIFDKKLDDETLSSFIS